MFCILLLKTGIIARQGQIFDWNDLENLGDLKRLHLVLENMPDEKLMRVLEKERYRGRNDYPVRAMWNAILAGVVPSLDFSTIFL